MWRFLCFCSFQKITLFAVFGTYNSKTINKPNFYVIFSALNTNSLLGTVVCSYRDPIKIQKNKLQF